VVELSQRLYERQFGQLPELLLKHTAFYEVDPIFWTKKDPFLR
jgi:hypothetical protein